MITREEFPNLSGLDDKRLSNPRSHKPPFRFGTIPNGATDYVLKNNFPNTHEYMKRYSMRVYCAHSPRPRGCEVKDAMFDLVHSSLVN